MKRTNYHPLSLVLASRLVKDERWIRAVRACAKVKGLVKVESGSIRGSGVRVDGEVHHFVLIIKTISEPHSSMSSIRGYTVVIGHQHKGAGHRAGIPAIPGFIYSDVEDAIEGLCDRTRNEAGRRWSDGDCLDGVLKMHRAGLRAISLSYRCARKSLGMSSG